MGLKAEQSRRTKQRLIEAAIALFAERGYAATSVKEIGDHAGISTGSIAHHFGSKEGLLHAVAEHAFSVFDGHIREARADAGSPLVRVFAAHRQFVETQPVIGRLFFVLMFEALGPEPSLLPRYAALHERFRAYASQWLGAAGAAGLVRSDVDPRAIGAAILGALGGLHYQWHLTPGAFDLREAHDALAVVVERGLAPERPVATAGRTRGDST